MYRKMIFTKARTLEMNQEKKKDFTLMNMQRIVQQSPKPVNVVQHRPHLERIHAAPLIKKVAWGEPFWNLFHVLAQKIIVDASFIWRKNQLLQVVYIICQNLPCPDCANHATRYMTSINFDAIQTKQQLKDLFYEFHNQVNLRRGVPLYPKAELDNKYSKGVTQAILVEFMRHFENKHKSVHMLANDFNRAGVAIRLKKWFNENIHWFEP